ncbi:type II secretion system F family protein [Streptomyces sp. NPDC050161]|uniref:type II secretion system F family protein n=1 Tax=Streptomyces sp. NPDC050161 TaxID=3365604 RepID=UPI00379FA6B9
MSAVLMWAGSGVLLAAGAVTAVRGLVGTSGPQRSSRWQRARAAWSGGRGQGVRAARRRALVAAAVVLGLGAWLVTGVFAGGLIAAGAMIGVPWLLAPTASADARIAQLEALGEWTQRLADGLWLGFGLEQAMIASRKNAPEALHSEITELADRLRLGEHPREALEHFASALDDITADKVCAALILSATDTGPGLARALEDLANSVREEIAKRRQIESDRAKPRTTVRWMTFISLAVCLGGFLVPSYTHPYGAVAGQLVLALVIGAFCAVLVWMRKLASHRPVPRFLIADPRSRVAQTPPAREAA